MGEISTNHHHHHDRPPPPPATRPSRLAVRGRIGEIVEVEGGHIVRSTGRKDRHSKVCTAKGPRDRRVRLSAHTAIQFYDVQDRLGYDRPSKAVDWLIKNAKSAIDELAKLPAWNPNTVVNQSHLKEKDRQQNQPVNQNEKEIPIGVMERFDEIEAEIENPNRGGGRLEFLPPNFDSEIIADSIKSLFPIAVSETNAASPTASFNYHNFSPPDLVSRRNANIPTSSSILNNQDLRLSLHSLEEPIPLHQAQNEELFSATTTTVGFHGASFQEEHERFHRMMPWNSTSGGTTDTIINNNNCHVSGGGGFNFNSAVPVIPTLVPPYIGQSHQCYSSQRGPLQSSNNNSNSNSNGNNNPLIRAWIDVTPDDHQNNHHHHHYNQSFPPMFHHQSLISGGGFDSGVFSGFRIPARIQGEEAYDSNKPSSASSDSLH